MDMRLVAPPTPGRIIVRAVLRGGLIGAVTGVVVLFGLALGTVGGLFVFSPVAAVIGFVAGAGCGLVAGLVLAAARWRLVGSRTAVRLTAAAGASAGPAASAAALGSAGQHAWLAALGLALMTFWLAFAGGAAAFYGKHDRASRSHAAIH